MPVRPEAGVRGEVLEAGKPVPSARERGSATPVGRRTGDARFSRA
jgi:hypothetical protein